MTRTLRGYVAAILTFATGTLDAMAGDDADGRSLYDQECAACHFDADLPLQSLHTGDARIIPVMMATYGPKLRGIVGRPAGSDPAFLYSANFMAGTKELVWTLKLLDQFLTDSRMLVPGTRMFYRQNDVEVRRKILAYLATTG
jgi:hypothetical protein